MRTTTGTRKGAQSGVTSPLATGFKCKIRQSETTILSQVSWINDPWLKLNKTMVKTANLNRKSKVQGTQWIKSIRRITRDWCDSGIINWENCIRMPSKGLVKKTMPTLWRLRCAVAVISLPLWLVSLMTVKKSNYLKLTKKAAETNHLHSMLMNKRKASWSSKTRIMTSLEVTAADLLMRSVLVGKTTITISHWLHRMRRVALRGKAVKKRDKIHNSMMMMLRQSFTEILGIV